MTSKMLKKKKILLINGDNLLCELSMNNSYLSLKSTDSQWNELLIDNQSIIKSLSSIIDDFESL